MHKRNGCSGDYYEKYQFCLYVCVCMQVNMIQYAQTPNSVSLSLSLGFCLSKDLIISAFGQKMFEKIIGCYSIELLLPVVY